MTSQRLSTSTQLGLALLIIVGVFAGGMAIARAANRPLSSTLTAADAAPVVLYPPASSAETDPASTPSLPVTIVEGRSASSAEATTPALPGATTSETPDDPPAPPIGDEPAGSVDDPCIWAPGLDELEENAAETAALEEVLTRFGIGYTTEQDEFGFRWLEWDTENPVVDAVVSSFYEDQYPTEDAIAENQALNDQLSAAFDAASIDYEIVEDGDWTWIEWDWTDDAANAISDTIYDEFYGPFDELDDYCFVEGDYGEDELTDDELAGCEPLDEGEWEAMLAERSGRLAALAAELETAGVAYSYEDVDEWTWLTFDLDDPAAVEVIGSALDAHSA